MRQYEDDAGNAVVELEHSDVLHDLNRLIEAVATVKAQGGRWPNRRYYLACIGIAESALREARERLEEAEHWLEEGPDEFEEPPC